jgi:hypothetical protein
MDDFTEPIATVIFIATKGHSSNDIVLKFSPASPTKNHAHQLLNTRQTKVFEDLKHSVLHTVLLAQARMVAVGTNMCVYICVPMGKSCAGTGSIPWRMFCWQSFYAK